MRWRALACIKAKTGRVPLARATSPPGNKAQVHPAGAFPMCGVSPAGADDEEIVNQRNGRHWYCTSDKICLRVCRPPSNAPTEVGPGCSQPPGLYLWCRKLLRGRQVLAAPPFEGTALSRRPTPAGHCYYNAAGRRIWRRDWKGPGCSRDV